MQVLPIAPAEAPVVQAFQGPAASVSVEQIDTTTSDSSPSPSPSPSGIMEATRSPSPFPSPSDDSAVPAADVLPASPSPSSTPSPVVEDDEESSGAEAPSATVVEAYPSAQQAAPEDAAEAPAEADTVISCLVDSAPDALAKPSMSAELEGPSVHHIKMSIVGCYRMTS